MAENILELRKDMNPQIDKKLSTKQDKEKQTHP